MPTPSATPIGVFDSGIGGLSILRALRTALPHEDFIYHADTAHAPYGERDGDFVVERSMAIARALVDRNHIKLLVVACNTATAAAIAPLRAAFPELPIVGVEPALKPAAQASRTHRVGVLATRGTLASEKFRQLHTSLASQATFVLQPCDGLAAAIENGDTHAVSRLCETYVKALGPLGWKSGEIDTLVLGCTHYAFAMDDLLALTDAKVQILETGEPVARQAWRLMDQARLLNPSTVKGRLHLRSPGAQDALEAAARRWLAA